jgi:hypothetical protein
MTCVGRSSDTWIATSDPPTWLAPQAVSSGCQPLSTQDFLLPSEKGKLRPSTTTPTFPKHIVGTTSLDVSFFGDRRPLSTYSPAQALPTTLYDHHHHHRHDHHVPHRCYTTVPTCTSFHVCVVPSFPCQLAKASFIGHCISYGNHKSRIIRIYSKEMQDFVHSRSPRVNI